MGFLNKKKQPSSVSALSENEIQKKLYGEFYTESTQVVTGERESSKESERPPALPRESVPEKKEDVDLFTLQKETLNRPVPFEPKPADRVARHVPIYDSGRKPAASAPQTSGADPYARFQYNRPSKSRLAALQDALKVFSGKIAEWSAAFMDPKHVVIRRVLYWGLAGLVVFLLFWGVNALNLRRELAMRARYKIAPEAVSLPVPVAVPVAVPVEPVPAVEREVVITPAPVRAPKATPAETSVSAQTPYVIQVVTYPTKQDAEQVVTTLKKEGLRAFVKESTRPSGRQFYLVLIGGFRTENEAQAQLIKFRAKEVARPFQDAFVKTSRS